MALDKTIASFSVLSAEVEAAGLTMQPSVFPKAFSFPPFYNAPVTLTSSM